MDQISSTKKKKKGRKEKKDELNTMSINVSKPGSKKYTHLDFNDVMKSNGIARDEDDQTRFYDEDTLMMAKKISETRTKSGKKIRINLDELQHYNRNCGYDMDDDFIDDTEALEVGNFTSRKGRFYVGKGDVKDLNDDEEDESEEEEEVVQEVQKRKKSFKPEKEKSKKNETERVAVESSSSSSDSEAEPVRMTGAPPTARMAGAPPSKRLLSRKPTPPPTAKKDPTPPSEPPKKKIAPVFAGSPVVSKPGTPAPSVLTTVSSSSSQSSDIVCLDDEPPVKKQKLPTEPVVKPVEKPEVKKPAPVASTISVAKSSTAPSTSSGSSSSSSGATASVSQASSSTKVVTMLAKKVHKEQADLQNQKSSATAPKIAVSVPKSVTPSTPTKPAKDLLTLNSSPALSASPSSPPSAKDQAVTAMKCKIFESLTKRGRDYQARGLKTFDDATLTEISQYIELLKFQRGDKIVNMEPLIYNVAQSFGLSSAEVMKRVESGFISGSSTTSSDSLEWKLSQADLPFLSENEINSMSAQVKSWRGLKEISNSVLTSWLKAVNQEKLNADQARKKLFDTILTLPNVEQQQEAAVELPKHERSRKARMFLNQWVYLSRKYVGMIMPSLKKPLPTDGFARKQLAAVEFMQETFKRKKEHFENKKAKGEHPTEATYIFTFSDPVLAAIAPYLEEVTDYALSTKKLETAVTAIDSLHRVVEEVIPPHTFYIELCRRLQKLTFLLVEEPMKSRLRLAGDSITKHQVVQNPKYQIKWPGGEEPSMRGLQSELHNFDKSVLCSRDGINPPTPSSAARPGFPIRPPANSTSLSTVASRTASSVSADDLKRHQSMNQPLQIYLRRYLLAAGNSITDSTKYPISDEILHLLVTVVAISGISQDDQLVMYKTIIDNVGQERMAQSVAVQRNKTNVKMTVLDFQKVSEFFSSLETRILKETAADKEKQKIAKIQEEIARKLEEKQKKEREKQLEKQMEKEKKEQEKREEKERKEREKREEKERKEKEMRENVERRRREEEDRLIAQRKLREQMEDQRRKREAEEAVEKELERRAKLEKEEANALQGLEEDLLMDDIDFMTEQQSKVDEERKIEEAKRAIERENQIKLMRARQLQRRTPPPPVVRAVVVPISVPIKQEEGSKEMYPTPSSSSSISYSSSQPLPTAPTPAKNNAHNSTFDILSAAQEAADLPMDMPPNPTPVAPISTEKPMSAREKLEQMRGRTMSADMKRGGGGDFGGNQGGQHQQLVVNMQGNSSPYIAPTNTQQFFPTQPASSSNSIPGSQPLHHQDPMMPPQQQQQQHQFQPQPASSSMPMASNSITQPLHHIDQVIPQQLQPQQQQQFQPQPSFNSNPMTQRLQHQNSSSNLQNNQMNMSSQLNQTNQMNQMNQRNQMAQMTPMNQMNQSNQSNQMNLANNMNQMNQTNNSNQPNQMNRMNSSNQLSQMNQGNNMNQMPPPPQQQVQMPQPMQQSQPRLSSSNSSGNMFYQEQEMRDPNRRSMSMSQPLTHLPQQHPQHQPSPQNVQQQQFPINSYQSPINSHNNSMSNSSVMHTPHSNSSMVSQSPQFSSHPSPMSQQFHTPPSVGMLNHPMIPSPMAATQPLQHFNFPPQQQQQPQQMHRQLSQQNLMMAQQQQQQNMLQNNMQNMHQQNQNLQQQQQHQMMQHHQMNQQNNHFPPNNH